MVALPERKKGKVFRLRQENFNDQALRVFTHPRSPSDLKNPVSLGFEKKIPTPVRRASQKKRKAFRIQKVSRPAPTSKNFHLGISDFFSERKKPLPRSIKEKRGSFPQ